MGGGGGGVVDVRRHKSLIVCCISELKILRLTQDISIQHDIF